MSSMNELIWSFKAKCVNIHSYSVGKVDDNCFINIFIPKSELKGWELLIDKLNKVFDNPFQLIKIDINFSEDVLLSIVFNNYSKDSELDKDILILSQCIINEEYKIYTPLNNRVFDIKLGISCNNNCKHCVIKPLVYEKKRQCSEGVILDSGIGMQCTSDLKLLEVVEILNKMDDDVGVIVLTGGEPTIREDLVSIVKWIYYNRPYTDISFQTNGRNLSDTNLVKVLRRYTRNPSFAVAIHGFEETHNLIVDNRKESGNPFQETLQGIRNLIDIFGTGNIRTEIVMSNYNIDEVFDAVKFHYENLGVKIVGISYPHLDGFTNKIIKELSPSLDKVFDVLRKLNEYLLEHDDLTVVIEEVPFCVYNQLDSEIRLRSFECRDRSNVSVNFIGEQNNCFNDCWVKDHTKYKKCKECIIDKECIGIWKESKTLNDEFIKPIKTLSEGMQKFLKTNWGCDEC